MFLVTAAVPESGFFTSTGTLTMWLEDYNTADKQTTTTMRHVGAGTHFVQTKKTFISHRDASLRVFEDLLQLCRDRLGPKQGRSSGEGSKCDIKTQKPQMTARRLQLLC